MTDQFSNYHDLNSLNGLRRTAKDDQRAALKSAVKEFEAYFLNLMLKNMRSANEVIGADSPLTSKDVSFYNEMYDKQLALHLSKNSNLGIGDILYEQLARSLPDESASVPDSSTQEKLERSPGEKEKPDLEASFNRVMELAGQDIKDILEQFQFSQINSQPRDIASSDVRKGERAVSEIESANPTTNVIAQGQATAIEKQQNPSFSDKFDFISQMKPFAIEAAKKLGLPPGVLVAQAALETGWGKFISQDQEGRSSFNLFGIKSDSRWQGDEVSVSTLEFEQGIPKRKMQNFRSYFNFEQSFNDYVEFIQNNSRYHEALKNTDSPKSYLDEIQNAGYATDPDYSNKIFSIFSREKLFDLQEAPQEQPSIPFVKP
ncbi:flagellar assembly peptidoglycan hydrolase FlgJ [Pleionea sp. CnH1-48]|uniref:flagellar assembly peptidoglycan hydrolase FlgJ n=1 Tax=Pleionea sp. CnH1-48 TaxID=2954494 RepID=UPI002096D235|nr:flagellar assembly peptidoglycan hydrolase FlgJ [Pleionea sp. CnH1-48]